MVTKPLSGTPEYRPTPEYAPSGPGSLLVREHMLETLVVREPRPVPPPGTTPSTTPSA